MGLSLYSKLQITSHAVSAVDLIVVCCSALHPGASLIRNDPGYELVVACSVPCSVPVI